MSRRVRGTSGRRVGRWALRIGGWGAVVLVVVVAILVTSTWVWWRAAPSVEVRSGGVNALWARHPWVGEAHTQREYEALAETLRQDEISDVFFRVGPLDVDGIPA